ncbi:hypothetical protein EDC17_101150 [Sphingobacterium alimentarium]|uniref:Uncharacterized protein n=1 Tax=Sphingobacterium alimentarium TaxID=797292 RepID=A0A4R3VUF0_9SPHI|nr:hypothetical protein [Sphingobacterium alimentarium]TCV17133.1 hypothetical protein EDC17_101150 [Sphingobacterium alimentarium]
MKHLFTIILILTSLTAFAQEVNENGRQLMRTFRVSIEGQDPKGYEIENKNVLFKIKHLTDTYITLEIHNNSDVMTTVNYSDSYFAVDGTTSRVIPEVTYMKEINAEIPNDIIAPGTKITKSLHSRDFNFIRPMLSNKRANKAFKAGEARPIEKLIMVVNVGDQKVTQTFNFQVIGTAELKTLDKKRK